MPPSAFRGFGPLQNTVCSTIGDGVVVRFHQVHARVLGLAGMGDGPISDGHRLPFAHEFHIRLAQRIRPDPRHELDQLPRSPDVMRRSAALAFLGRAQVVQRAIRPPEQVVRGLRVRHHPFEGLVKFFQRDHFVDKRLPRLAETSRRLPCLTEGIGGDFRERVRHIRFRPPGGGAPFEEQAY